MEQFRGPVFATRQPVLICFAKPAVYLPSQELYAKYPHAHPGTFQTEVKKYNQMLPLDPTEKMTWGDMTFNEEVVDMPLAQVYSERRSARRSFCISS
jgi:hypothetical protein